MARKSTISTWWKCPLRTLVCYDGDVFALTYRSRRPHLGPGLWAVIENPRRGLKIVRYRDLSPAGQTKSPNNET